MNCASCGSVILMHEPTGRCLECSADLCSQCHGDYCKPCDNRFATNLVAELKALDPPPTAKEPTWAHESGLSRRRHQWEDLGYGT